MMRLPPILTYDHHDSSTGATRPATTTRRFVDVEDDQENEYRAALARHQASELVRDHLESHVANNPGASSDYVTWIATLHPENANITIDERFFIPGNPWWTIYEETKNQTIPTATAVAVTDDDDDEESPGQQSSSNDNSNHSATKYHANNAAPSFCMTCSPINLFTGLLLSLHVLLIVLICEVLALFLGHLPASLCYYSAQRCCCFREGALPSPFYPCLGLGYSFAMMGYYIFALCDSIILLTSVVVTESIAMVGWLLGIVTGGMIWGQYWHQLIRRMGHGIRILFRNKQQPMPMTDPAADADDAYPSPTPRHILCCWYSGNRGGCPSSSSSSLSLSTSEQQRRNEAMEQQNRTMMEVLVPVQVLQQQHNDHHQNNHPKNFPPTPTAPATTATLQKYNESEANTTR